MSIKRLLTLCVCLLCLCAAPSNADANAKPIRSRQATGADQRTDAPVGVEVARGAIKLTRGADSVISNARLRLRFGDNSTVTGDFEPSGRDAGADAAGRYELWRYDFKPG
ncbi:MAG TPA: hypothetical protein VIP46_08920, partial [Pyrinomonadaceae bacterium]